MTLPASGVISLSDVLTEIRVVNPARALPISLGDADVRNLAGVASGAISLSNLYGKRSYIPMVGTGINDLSSGTATGVNQFTGSTFPSVSVSQGRGTYRYLWSITSSTDGSFALTNPTSQTCTIRHVVSKFGYIGSATLQCVITDDIASITVSGVVAAYNWTYP